MVRSSLRKIIYEESMQLSVGILAGDWEGNKESTRDTAMNRRDAEYKGKIKKKTRNKNTKEHNLITGDHVLLKRKKTNKWSTAFDPAFYIL